MLCFETDFTAQQVGKSTPPYGGFYRFY